MTNKVLIEKIEADEKWIKVRIDARGEVTGMLADEDHWYDPRTNTGGRRFIGYSHELTVEYQD